MDLLIRVYLKFTILNKLRYFFIIRYIFKSRYLTIKDGANHRFFDTFY